MTWRLARSLATLREQINTLSPNRSKASDGTVGDARHAATKSDHNPDANGIVRALDITHDPKNGVAGKALANALLATRDPRIKYIISDGQIASGAGGSRPWVWRKYTGANAHTKHVHLSVVAGAKGDDAAQWAINLSVPPATAATPVEAPADPVLALGTKGPDVERMQRLLIAAGAKILLDSDFGPKTEAALKAFQKRAKLVADGRCAPYTWAALRAAK